MTGLLLLLIWVTASTPAAACFFVMWQGERRQRRKAEEMNERHLKVLQRYWKLEDRAYRILTGKEKT